MFVTNAHLRFLNSFIYEAPIAVGIRCGTKGTSCPDQLSMALEKLKQMPML